MSGWLINYLLNLNLNELIQGMAMGNLGLKNMLI